MAKPSKTSWFSSAKSWDFVAITSIISEAPELLAATDPKGLNALHMACSVKPGKNGVKEPNGPEFARELVKYNPRMNLRGGNGRTVLHAAVVPHRLEVLELYLDAGADLRIRDN